MSDRRNPLRYVFAFFLFALSLFAITWVAKQFFDPSVAVLSVEAPLTAPGDLLSNERNSIEVFQRASPAVVFVHNLQLQRNRWTRNETEVQQGTGSGFLWDKHGHIVTNFHVIQGASRIAVTLIDGNTYPAEVVGVEPKKDLAVLKIELLETNVQPFEEKVADSSQILVGQKAIAIGNPFGLDHTLTVGAVSAVSRSTRSMIEGLTIREMIQIDAAINPGNSGGPLLDSKGRLLGMNTLILKNSTGIGFAVPANTIKRIVKQIIQYGHPVQTGIGISVYEDRVSAFITRRVGIKLAGVLLMETSPGGPADQAGLRGTSEDGSGNVILGDLIVEIGGQPIAVVDDLYHALDQKLAGENVEIVYIRDGERFTVNVELVTISE